MDERIEKCLEGDFLLVAEGSDFYRKEESEKINPLDFKKIFGNQNEVNLEIGCGKGGFAFAIAKRDKDKNFIAIEKISNVIVEACEKADAERPKNLRFMNCAAENLSYYIPKNSISAIYLNFSCPYPKGAYRNRRLTYYRYLRLYQTLLIEDGKIFMKTDDRKFFEFSLRSFSENDFIIQDLSLDLYADDDPNNIQTEYEKNFVEQGRKIYKAVVGKKRLN